MKDCKLIIDGAAILIGIGSIIANIWIAKYNAGKNRTIYDIENIAVDKNGADNLQRTLGKVKEKLSSGKYTVLSVISEPTRTDIYVLGKVENDH